MNKKYMNYLGHIFILISMLFTSTLTFAESSNTSTPFSKIVFFGDSLSDNGNLYADLLGFFPKSPPYYHGRFSNGPTWAELVDQYYLKKNSVQAVNYAIGGQTAILHNPFRGYLPYTLTMSLDIYLLDTLLRDRSSTLFVVWIGANDYLPSVDNLGQLSSDVTNSVKATIESLIYHGGKNFLVLKLPDLGQTPFARTVTYQEGLKAATTVHNLKLEAVVDEIKDGYKSVKIEIVNADQLLNDFVKNIDAYNQKYNTHVTNTTDSCWKGGYTFAEKKTSETDIARQYEKFLRSKTFTAHDQKPMEPAEVARYISSSPALLEAYKVSEDPNTVRCADPDAYLFWDKVHPTAALHKMISQYLIEFIDQNYTPA